MFTNNDKRKRYIYIRYNFMEDVITQGGISLEYIPTKDMVSDILMTVLAIQ